MSTRRVLPIAVVLLVCGGYLAYELTAQQSTAPPPDVKTLRSFVNWQAESLPAVVHTSGDSEHLIVYGRQRQLLYSGPPAYVFDRSGQLIEWTADSGDDPDFQTRWNPLGERIEIDALRADQWLDGRPIERTQ